jgi:hypothetical protein
MWFRRLIISGKKNDGRAVPAVIVPIKDVEKLSSNSCRLDTVIDSERVISALWPLTTSDGERRNRLPGNPLKDVVISDRLFMNLPFWALGLKGNEDNFLRLSRITPLRKLEHLPDEVENT